MPSVLGVVARDIDDYQRLVDCLLAAQIGIERYFTYIVTKSIKCVAPDLMTLKDNP